MTDTSGPDDRVTIALTGDEALVLFEWLVAFNKSNPVLADQAEQQVLWDLEAMLESNIPGIFSPDYSLRLAAARERVRDSK